MRRSTPMGVFGWLVCAGMALAQAPPPRVPSPSGQAGAQPLVRAVKAAPLPRAVSPPAEGSDQGDDSRLAAAQQELENSSHELERLKQEQAKTKDVKEAERLQKQLELQQKQIETLQKMVRLLADQLKKQPPAGAAVEKVQTHIATLEARARQAAQRDQEVAGAIDNLVEQRDADQRDGPQLPATLKELFFPSETNETPLSFYGFFASNYHKFPHSAGAGEFEFEEFEPFFLLTLNQWISLEIELGIHSEGAGIDQAQVDFMVNDWLTVVAGRFSGPTGWFNERMHPAWINKLPDFPLVFKQVALADYSLNGIQFRGGHYLGCLPVKMEYSAFVANGFGLPEGAGLNDLANLEAQRDTTTGINEAMAYGGRLGLWLPEMGLTAGASLFFNTPYTEVSGSDITCWQLDAGYHKGNWDVRFEYANLVQGTRGITDDRIRRRGLYAQVAYRPYDAINRFLQKAEVVFRYSRARFNGIDPTALDLSGFESPIDVPVDRDQYTFGINYYFYPSLVLKFAYEINHEVGDLQLKDSLFTAQLAWGF